MKETMLANTSDMVRVAASSAAWGWPRMQEPAKHVLQVAAYLLLEALWYAKHTLHREDKLCR